ncbi:hypothetical protein JCM6882_003256 [Rhodosporidiobolus microsporus]
MQPSTPAGAQLKSEVSAYLATATTGTRATQWTDTWTAFTESEAMQDLVSRRSEIFAKLRLLNRPDLQAASYDMAAAHLAQFSETNIVPRNTVKAYSRFCQLHSLPVFPLLPATVALCVFTKCSIVDGHYQTFKSELERVRVASAPLWQNEPLYQELLVYDGDGQGLRELMRERGLMRKAQKGNLSALSSTGSESEPEPEKVEDVVFPPASVDSVAQLDCPGLPRTDSVWPSFDAVYLAFFVAIVPVYGIGVAVCIRNSTNGQIHCNRAHQQYRNRPPGVCPFRVNFKLDSDKGGWVINSDTSELRHNHERDPRIAEDPSWRPIIKNVQAKAALAEADASRSAPLAHLVSSIATDSLVPVKRERTDSPTAAERAPLPPAKRPPRDPYLVDSSAFLPPQLPPPLTTLSSTSSATSNLSFYPPTPILPLDSNHLVTTFLVSLNPSLAPLAPHLIAAAIDSEQALAELTMLDPQCVDLFVEALRLSSEIEVRRRAGAERISVLQARLFAKAVKALR